MSFIQVTKEEFNTHAFVLSVSPFQREIRNSGGKLMKLALLGTGMIVTEVLPVLTPIEGIELEAILSTPRSLDKAEALAKPVSYTHLLSTVVGDEKLTSREDLIGLLFFYV